MNHHLMNRQNEPHTRLSRILDIGHICGILCCLIISGICLYQAFYVAA